jgi:signal transduction histidine kinase/FixJ family two-component response regulator
MSQTVSPSDRTAARTRRSAPSDVVSYLGILTMTLLVIVIVGIGIVGMRQIQSSGEDIVQDRFRKMRLLQAMGTAARERMEILQQMLINPDPFERDRLNLDYLSRGAIFAGARAEFTAIALTGGEQELMARQGELARTAETALNRVLELIHENQAEPARRALAESAVPAQYRMLGALSELMDYQTVAALDSVQRTQSFFEHGRAASMLMALAALAVAAVLILLVRRAALQRREYLARVEAADQAKSAFLAKMSHEMRTPLSSIIGFAELSMEGNQTVDERIRALKTIHASGQHLLGLINDILDLSKIEAQKLAVDIAPEPVLGIVNEVAALLRAQAESKELNFAVDIDFPLPQMIATDRLRLKQILINLGGNAIKFTERGEVRLRVRYDGTRRAVEFQVEDSGIGMSAETQRRLFEDFHQADASITRRFGGTGLGLSISQKLAVLLGGKIAVSSAPGVGSTFTLTLHLAAEPVEWVDRVAQDAEPQPAVETPPANRRYAGKVLVVDDTAALRELVTLYLAHAGVDVTVAENGQVAVERARQTKFDLIMMDIQMPVLDGVSAIRQLRDGGYASPVVAVTANAMKEDRQRYRDAGFDGHLAKPVLRAHVYALLERHLERAAPAAPNVDEAPIEARFLDPDDALDADLQRVVTKFIAELPGYRQRISAALAARDWSTVHELVHQLKGMGGAMGYPVITEVASAMMFQIRAENAAEAEQLNARLASTIERILRGRAATPRAAARSF